MSGDDEVAAPTTDHGQEILSGNTPVKLGLDTTTSEDLMSPDINVELPCEPAAPSRKRSGGPAAVAPEDANTGQADLPRADSTPINTPLASTTLAADLGNVEMGPPKRARFNVEMDDAASVAPIVQQDSGKDSRGGGGLYDVQESAPVSSAAQKFDFDSSDSEDDVVVPSRLSRPFDTKLLCDSIRNGEESLQDVAGKDVVLVVGKTGTGKSTLIQGIAGKELRAVVHQTKQWDGTAQKQVFEAADPLSKFDIGHAKTSMTKQINCYVRGTSEDAVYLDTPGFEDTDGHEIDIATSVMLSKVARQCRSLRFVILINCASLLEDRGGAFRAVLKQIRNFVPVFNDAKQSFMFLFTHIDEIHIGTHSIDSQRGFLAGEVIRTAEGTMDDGTLSVLKFMQKSLKKGFPFVDILHPLKTDFSKLVQTIEDPEILKPFATDHLARNCGLTSASRLTLSSELQSLVQRIRQLLASESPDWPSIMQDLRTAGTFQNYIDIEDVRTAHFEVIDLVKHKIACLRASIQDEVDRGTSLTREFGPKGIASLKQKMMQLQDLSDEFPTETAVERLELLIAEKVAELQAQSCTIEDLHRQLGKLQVWSEGFSSLSDHYTKALDNLKRKIDAAAASPECDIQALSLQMLQEDRVQSIIGNLCFLKSVVDKSEELSGYVDVKTAVDAFHKVVTQIETTLDGWENNAEQSITPGKEQVKSFVAQARAVGALHAALDKALVFPQLVDRTHSLCTAVTNSATEYFATQCTEFNDGFLSTNADSEGQLGGLRMISELFVDMKNPMVTSRVLSDYASVIESVKSTLKIRSGELDEMSQTAKALGIRDDRDVQALRSFVAHQWFDKFLPQQDQFVQACSLKFKGTYKARIGQVNKGIDDNFSLLFDDSCDSGDKATACSALQLCFIEMSYFASFAPVLNDQSLSKIEESAMKTFAEYIEKLINTASEGLSAWYRLLANALEGPVSGITVATETIHKALCDIRSARAIFSGSHSDLAELDNIQKAIQDKCELFGQKVRATINSERGYQAKAWCLSAVEDLGTFSCTAPLLPDFEKMREEVRIHVATDAKVLEDMVSETSEFEEMDKLLKEFEVAKVLDQFTSNEASSRLRPLYQLREQKETQVDDHVREMIEQKNYHGMREFLAPMAAAKSQMKKQKFQHCRMLICKSLMATVDDVERQLKMDVSEERARRICAGLETLGQAVTELIGKGKLIQDRAVGPPRLKELHQATDHKLQQLLVQMREAIRATNYAKLGMAKAKAVIIHEHLGSHVAKATRTNYDEAMDIYRNAINDVECFRRKFVESSFKVAKDLLAALSSLHVAVGASDLHVPELERLYNDTKMALTDDLNLVFDNINDYISQSHCFDDGIGTFINLEKQLRNGLKDHLCQAKLKFDCSTQLQIWRSDRQKHDKEMEFEGFEAKHKIQDWAKQLNRLEGSSSRFSLLEFRWYNGTTYNKLKSKMEDKVSRKFAQCKEALQNGDHQLVQECIYVLELIHQHLKKHVPSATHSFKMSKQLALQKFEVLSEKCQLVLAQPEGSRQFEGLFNDYRSFVIEIPCVMASADARRSFSLTNQLLFEAVSKDIAELEDLVQSFNFAEIKSSVESLRAFGRFLMDNCTVFLEEVNFSEHVEMDNWLERLSDLIVKNFNCGRDRSLIKHYAVLGITPSATKNNVKKAYRVASKKWHPDKQRDPTGVKFRRINEAWDALKDVDGVVPRGSKPFDEMLKSIGTELRKAVRAYLSEERYEKVETLLFQLGGLHMLDDLISPKLDSKRTCEEVTTLVASHVRKVRLEVESNWAERQYRALNDNITDLKAMETNFKEYPKVFSSSWNDGIVNKVETEIKNLGSHARLHLRTQAVAKSQLDAFRADFIKMGFVMVELPLFKEVTKATMSNVLESCLAADWGYGYLFELGLSLQKGDESSSEDENRIGQVIVAEFNHFKEVLTMVWNEETSQKPAEDTVSDITGETRTPGPNVFTSSTISVAKVVELDVDRDRLLASHRVFELEYKALLGEFINPEADLNNLVQKTVSVANRMKAEDLTCNTNWNEGVKSQVPQVLAGVFALFTILKSGASFNRLSEADGAAGMGEKLLKKPHNIQVLTLLCMLGCGAPLRTSLASQLMQIRTGEGKSMILGAAAAVLGLLGFRVRCVCYSEYLSDRDYNLFKDVFKYYQLIDCIKYSKITKLSEDTTSAKGDIRKLTESLLRGQIDMGDSTSKRARYTRALSGSEIAVAADGTGVSSTSIGSSPVRKRKTRAASAAAAASTVSTNYAATEIPAGAEEILLVDEVDVFFGADFYGQTYNQVAELREPEVADILQHIWSVNKLGGRRQRLSDVKKLPAYKRLLQKIPHYAFLLDNEVSLMLDQVRRVDDEPYFLDCETDRIGYKIMDTISYEATYGYRTAFAYLKEADRGNLKSSDILESVLTMQISCGQFSYANIAPAKILGVSGTLKAMSEYEKDVMARYGIETFVYIPSVYGASNFEFDQAGEGISIEANTSDYFHSIADKITTVAKQKRAVIVFFQDNLRLKEFTDSAFYRKLGRKKQLLTEEMSAAQKEFAISKAATAEQITVCSAVFGRGTDFFCKDDRVQNNGGVHVIQAFFSAELSEEIQLQGRTSRQGKKGSYSMVLLESDLELQFGIARGAKDSVARNDRYKWLCSARNTNYEKHCEMIEENMAVATEKDKRAHAYFDALLAGDQETAHALFRDMYTSTKAQKRSVDVDLAFVMDCTGSMGSLIAACRDKVVAISKKIHATIGDDAKVRMAFVGYRDFTGQGLAYDAPGHLQVQKFTEDIGAFSSFVGSMTANGGGDSPEDVCGGLHATAQLDWVAPSRHMFLIADAPCHGTRYHSLDDNFPKGDPKQRIPEHQLVEMMRAMGSEASFKVTFLKLKPHTDQMLTIFNQHCLEQLGEEDTIDVVDLSKCTGEGIATQFEESVVHQVEFLR